MKFLNLFITLISSIVIPSLSFAKNQLVHFEPEIVQLTGTVEKQVFAGPPNYGSIKDGDEIEKGVYLRLLKPVGVDLIPTANNDLNEPEKM